MATLRMKTGDVIIFQLIRKNLKGNDASQRAWKEVKTFHLAVKPALITYAEGSRASITQTSPNSGFVDKFGSKLVQVTIVGTFGIQPRRQGLVLKDGYTRLLEFRDELFRQSQLARQQKEDGDGNQYVYAVNYYDFINNEKFVINFDTFVRTLDAKRNPFEPIYQLSFTALGEPIEEVTTSDPILQWLLTVDEIFNEIDTKLSIITENETFQKISQAVELFDTMTENVEDIEDLISKYSSAIAGQLFSTKRAAASAKQNLTLIPNEIGKIIGIKG